MLTVRLGREADEKAPDIGRQVISCDMGFSYGGALLDTRSLADESCRIAALLAADAFQVALELFTAPTRGGTATARARQVAMYIAHVALGIRLSAIGRYFGRDHSTVAHNCSRIEDRRDDAAFDAVIVELGLAARIALHLDREIAI